MVLPRHASPNGATETPTARSIEELLAEESPDVMLRSRQEVTEVAKHVERSARHRLVGFWDNSPRTAELFEAPIAAHRRQVAAAPKPPNLTRIMFETSALGYPQAAEVLIARGRGGAAIRVLERLPFTLLIADTDVALLDLSTYESAGYGSQLIRSRVRLLALAGLADTLWEMGIPTKCNASSGLDADTQRVLTYLAAGATDAGVARHTGQSVRTVERRTKRILTQLGATTRFQAGVQAARRGWI